MTQGTNVVALKAGGPILGIVPQNVDEIFRLASGIAKSGLAPPSMATAEKLMVAIMTGLELGLPPMFAINKIAVINGRPSLWGDALPALLWSRGFKVHERFDGEGMKTVATCTVTRPDGEKIERSFSVADAQAAGLWGKQGPWKQYPNRMLQMRARGFAARDGAADVLGGLYLHEEIESSHQSEPINISPAVDSLPMPPEISSVRDDAELDDMLADAEGFLAKLSEDRGFCQSEDDVHELRESNEDLIKRLSAADQERAEKILQGAAE